MKKTYVLLLLNFIAASVLSALCIALFAKNFSASKAIEPHWQKKNANAYLPITGFCSESFENFDGGIIKFLTTRGFDGATLAIIKDGEFLVKRGYGWSDKGQTKAMESDDFLRIASLTKILTAIAIKKLIQDKKLSYETPVIDFLGINQNIQDPNLKKINVLHLLLHEGGWNSNQSLDPLFSLGMITNKFNKELANITSTDVLRYVVENTSLDFAPGTSSKYSNIGYTILGRVIEKANKANYVQVINNLICKPENVRVESGPAQLSGKSANEIEFYKSNDINLNNDSISLRAADSSFGLITSAPYLCKILDKYWIDGDAKNNGDQRQLSKTGTLPGCMTLARQRYSGASIVVLINSRDNNNPEIDNIILTQLIDNLANQAGI